MDRMPLKNLLTGAAIETIFEALADRSTPSHVRANLALKVLDWVGQFPHTQLQNEKRAVIDSQTIQMIREQVYGIFPNDPELPNGGVKNMEVPGRN